MSDTLERLRKVAPIHDHREFATVRVDLLTAAAEEIQTLSSKLDRYQSLTLELRKFFDAGQIDRNTDLYLLLCELEPK